MTVHRIELIRQAALAAQRRRQLACWEEQFNRLAATPTRTPDEAVAKAQALELLREARP